MQVLIAEVDCTQNRPLCGAQGVKGFPTLMRFQRGQDAAKYQGGRNFEQFDRHVQRHLLERPCNPEFDFDSDGINDCGEKIPQPSKEKIPQPSKEKVPQPGQDETNDSSSEKGTEFLMTLPYAVARPGKDKERVSEFEEQVRKATEWWKALQVDAVELVGRGIKGVKKLGEALSIAVPLIIYAKDPQVR